MLKLYINIALLLIGFMANAQETLQSLKTQREKNLQLERQFFIRAGVDLSRFALPLINELNPHGVEFSLDAEVKYRFFPTLEAGMSKIAYKKPELTYNSQGKYLRFGINYNMVNYKQRFDRNLFFVGARYAMSSFNQEIPNVIISNEWGDFQESYPNVDHNAKWFEGVIGIRGEIFKNFYMGYTIRIKQMLNHTEFNDITPYWIPGYGKGNQNRTLGMSYSVFYAIPVKNPKPVLPK